MISTKLSCFFLTKIKAKIKALLSFVTVPSNTQRIAYLEPRTKSSDKSTSELPETWLKKSSSPRAERNNAAITFQVACMEKLDKAEKGEKDDKSTNKLEQHEAEYIEMIKRHPQLLKPTFDKKPPVHGVYHRIDTADHPPSRAKRRPLIADAAKAAEGRRIWKQMEDYGVIERVSPGANTDWASALHLANKPGGRVRSCTDFRLPQQEDHLGCQMTASPS